MFDVVGQFQSRIFKLFMTTPNSNADVALNFYWVVLKEPDLNPVPEKWIKAFHFFIFFRFSKNPFFTYYDTL